MKSYKFKVNENGYTVHIKSHEDNIINLEVNGTTYAVKMNEDIKKTKTAHYRIAHGLLFVMQDKTAYAVKRALIMPLTTAISALPSI